MIRIAICDKDIHSLEAMHKNILGLVRQHSAEEYLVRRFHSVYDLLECLENPNLSFNVYFLEIDMPIYSGIEVGRMIRQNDEYAVIVYTTTSKDFALDAMSTSPLQYMLKPIEQEQLKAVLDSAIRKVDQSATKNVLIKRKDGLANVGLHQIEYVEYKDHALTFYLSDGRTIPSRVIHESFSWVVENTLNDPRFVKPHSSYVVNMHHVKAMTGKEFEMDCGAQIPISKRVYSEVKQQFINYMTQKNGACIL